MKKLLLLILILGAATIQGQNSKKFRYSLSYEDTQTPSVFKTMGKSGKADAYKSKDGAVLKVGDTITFRHAFANIGKDASFYSTIVEGDPYDAGRAVLGSLSALSGVPPTPLRPMREARGEQAIIEVIRWSRTSKKRPANMLLTVRSLYGASGGAAKLTVTDLELSFEYKEVYHPTLPISKEELVSTLKQAKEELDLGLLEETEFEKIKKEVLKKIKELKDKPTS